MSTPATGRPSPETSPAPPRRPIGLRWIVSIAAAVLTAAIVVVVGATAERRARVALTRELQTRVVFEARNLALTSAGALLSDFPELTLTPILAELREGQDELAFADVVDREGTILGHADARRIGESHALPPDLATLPEVVGLAEGEAVLANAEVLVASAPVRRPGSGEPIGTAYVAIDRSYVEAVLAGARREQILLMAGLLAAGIVLVLVLMSVLLRPLGALRSGLERIGRGDLETPVRLKDRTELGLLADTMNDMAARIRVAQRERNEKERLAHEVDLAREIQSSLLPAAGGFRKPGVTVTGSHRAAAEVGGDYWNVFELPDGRVGVAVADVAGKGLAGCLVASMLSALLGSCRRTETSPKAVLVRLEDDLRDSLRPGTFVTMFYGILDPGTGRFVFASAGHSPLLVRRGDGRIEWYRTKGIPIGVMRGGLLEKSLRDEAIDLAPGDLAVQYTDGINEAFEPGGEEQFGFARLEQSVGAAPAGDGPGVLTRVRGDVETWVGDQPPLDDETVVVICRDAEPAEPASPVTLLARARETGCHLRLPARLDALTGLTGRFPDCPSLLSLGPRDRHVLESALYEVCANVIEHGLGSEREVDFDLWWLPLEADTGSEGSSDRDSPPTRGTFVLLDHGVPFEPAADHSVDFGDPSVRRRGRGLGLEILRAAMRSVEYHPATGEGNVTILEFDSSVIRNGEEVIHER